MENPHGEFNSDWGLCKDCKWWQLEPAARTNGIALGQCIEEKLQPFVLRVSGNSAVTASPGAAIRN